MRKCYLLLVLAFFYHTLLAETPRKTVNTSIDKVTVFLTGAQVTRTGNTTIQPGTTTLLFSNIAPNIQTQSIQVSSEGNFTVLSVVYQLNYLQQQEKNQEIDRLSKIKISLQDRLDVENSLLNVYAQEEQVLQANKAIGGEQQGVNINDLKQAADFYRTRLSEIKLKQLEIGKTIRSLTEQMSITDKQLNALHAQPDQPTGEIVVTVSSKTVVQAKFAVSYLVNQAGWHPTYDIRVKNISNPISLVYKANVFQQSGEDWNNVKLTISTGNPQEGGTKPVLTPWQLSFFHPHATTYATMVAPAMAGVNIRQIRGRITASDGNGLPGVNIQIKGSTVGTSTDANGNYILTIPANSSTVVYSFIGYHTLESPIHSPVMNFTLQEDITSLNEVVITGYGVSRGLAGKIAGVVTKKKDQEEASIPVNATMVRNQTQATFSIDYPYTIPTDGKQYTVDMKEYSVPADYEYYCTPKLDPDAFLMAKITNWDEYNLLEGEANLFFEGTFLGKSLLDVQTFTDTLQLSLGRDKNIVVSRTKLPNFTTKQFIGANKKEARAFEINIRNKKAQPITLIVEDQFPVSTNKDIEVTRLESSQATVEEETGKLTWQVKINPAQQKKLTVSYEVKYPKKERVLLE
ncbi:mucoidy inhibitor MuiA family protein [Rhodocytophaga aerolata]|uniref:Mucoidy inhibitor MuiA family protein n=1 Tax=Rhodocytophaga aerolata TaxID=455078 RepID=A0ABT8RAI3_9BACT|nr:mucoidy inhibitor MuiA family protein [Rhodocytophaga aerolata]MDO1449092.1 mucoidy inhibitor MuiA family protein [Rhodocytophaga aerolata]